MTTKKPNYKELVIEAEAAVMAVKDPELRLVAFEKILEQLLTVRDNSSTKKSAVTSRRTHETRKTHRGPRSYIEELINEKFFADQKTIAEVKAELANRGHHIPITGLSGPLQKLCQAKLLRRQKRKAESKKTAVYAYSDW